MIAGHETTANSLSWALFELTRHPEIQNKLRAEIREKIAEKDHSVFSGNDYENMPYLTAVVKVNRTFLSLHLTWVSFSYLTAQETLRLWPVAYILYREAAADDVLPLSKSITLTNGKVVNELPIPKGQKIIASVIEYNRLGSTSFSALCGLIC
jgi:cytochrome P450